MPGQRQPGRGSAGAGAQPSLPQDEIAGNSRARIGMSAAVLQPAAQDRTGLIEQRQGLYWLIRVRLGVITFLLVVQLIVIQLTDTRSQPWPFVFVIVLWYTQTLFFAFLVRIWPDYVTQIYLQILSDACFLTGIVYLSGGVESYFIFLFPLIVVAAGVSLPKPGPYLVASVSFILLGSML